MTPARIPSPKTKWLACTATWTWFTKHGSPTTSPLLSPWRPVWWNNVRTPSPWSGSHQSRAISMTGELRLQRDWPRGRSVYFWLELYCIFRDGETHMDMTCSWGSGVLSFDTYIYPKCPSVRAHVLSRPVDHENWNCSPTFPSGDSYSFFLFGHFFSHSRHMCDQLNTLFMIKWLIYWHYRTSQKHLSDPERAFSSFSLDDSVLWNFVESLGYFAPLSCIAAQRAGEVY